MARNDATATGAGAQPAQGCISAATEPVLREDAESSTRLAVYARVMLWANTACSETWEIQYYDSHDNNWFTLGSSGASSSGFGTYHLGDVKAECLAGSWAYRVAGTAWHTRAVRLTCHNPDDPFRIG